MLGTKLRACGSPPDVVLGLAPGGVPVALEIALALGSPLDVFVVRSLPWPGEEDKTMGVIAAGGVRVLDRSIVAERDVAAGVIDEVARQQAMELARLERSYRGHRRPRRITGRAVVLADDGLTPAGPLVSAVEALSAYRPSRVIVALPVISLEAEALLQGKASRVVRLELRDASNLACVYPEVLGPVPPREVRALLREADEQRPRPRAALG